MYVMPFMARLGITSSWNGWDITGAGVDLVHRLQLRHIQWAINVGFYMALDILGSRIMGKFENW